MPNLVRGQAERDTFLVDFLKMNDLEGAPTVGMPEVMKMYDQLDAEGRQFLLPKNRGVSEERVKYVSDQLEGLIALEEFVRANTIDHNGRYEEEIEYRKQVYNTPFAPELMQQVYGEFKAQLD